MSKNLSVCPPPEIIQRKIYVIRGKKIMMAHDLAQLYGVPTKVLNQAVRRNADRFPADFMFELTKRETQNWKSQFVTSNLGMKMGLRRNPYAFTEPGIAMLSSVLNSNTAVHVNIQIIRTFIKLRELLNTNELIRKKIEELERKYEKHDKQFKIIFEAIRELLEAPVPASRRPIGFHSKY